MNRMPTTSDAPRFSRPSAPGTPPPARLAPPQEKELLRPDLERPTVDVRPGAPHLPKFVTEAQASAPRLRFEFLDGLRGLAALYVVLFHMEVQFPDNNPFLPPLLRALVNLTRYGHYAVTVFIVLSGFCLMLPVARSAEGQLRGGVWQYIKRRAWRILPPYYAALGVALLLPILPHLLAMAVHALHHKPPMNALAFLGWNAALLRNLALHIFVAHNLFKASSGTINPPLWSVGLEWQIYFLLPALLLPLWRRAGVFGLVVAAYALGVAPHFLLPRSINLDWTCPWYVGVFALGMAGAIIASAQTGMRTYAVRNAPWGIISGLLFAALAVLAIVHTDWLCGTAFLWATDLLAGCATVALILHCARAAQVAHVTGHRAGVLTLLEAPKLLRLGGFSYSLYLVHGPVVNLLKFMITCFHMSGTWQVALEFMLGLPLSLAAGWLFYRLVEQRFTQAPVPVTKGLVPAWLAARPSQEIKTLVPSRLPTMPQAAAEVSVSQ